MPWGNGGSLLGLFYIYISGMWLATACTSVLFIRFGEVCLIIPVPLQIGDGIYLLTGNVLKKMRKEGMIRFSPDRRSIGSEMVAGAIWKGKGKA